MGSDQGASKSQENQTKCIQMCHQLPQNSSKVQFDTLLKTNVATLGQIQENQHVPYTGPQSICEHVFFQKKTLTCTFGNPCRRSETGTIHYAQQDPALWKVHVSMEYSSFGPAMKYRLVLFDHIWCFQHKNIGKYMLVGLVFKKKCSIYSSSKNHLTKHE